MAATDYYRLPNGTESDGLLNLFLYLNTVSDGIFFPAIFLVIYAVVLIVGFYSTSAGRAFIYASFFTGVIAMPAAVLGLIAPKIMYFFLLSLGIGVLLKTIEDRQ